MIALFRVQNYKHLFYNLLPVILLLFNEIYKIEMKVNLTDILLYKECKVLVFIYLYEYVSAKDIFQFFCGQSIALSERM